MKTYKVIYIFLFVISGIAISGNKITKKISFYNESENNKEAEILKSIFKIISTESNFDSEKKNIGTINLHYPKNPRHPVLMAFADIKKLSITFKRPDEKSPWDSGSYYPGGEYSTLYQAHLPSFSEAFFSSENMKLIEALAKLFLRKISHKNNLFTIKQFHICN